MRAVARTVTITAVPRDVWGVMADVEEWPAWASYMKRLQRLDDGPFGHSSRVKVTPKGLPGAVWTVTEYDPPRSYTWTTRLAPGLGLTGGHVVRAAGGATTATFSLEATGALGRLLAPVLQVIFRRNTRLATEGLKRYCEARR